MSDAPSNTIITHRPASLYYLRLQGKGILLDRLKSLKVSEQVFEAAFLPLLQIVFTYMLFRSVVSVSY